MDTVDDIPLGAKLMALLRIAYTELQYWLVGLTPETYHLNQSRDYERLNAFSRSAHHCRRMLQLTEHAETRARLALCYSELGNNNDAVREYRKAVATWDHPGIVLGLAQAEFRAGNPETALELLKRVQNSDMREELRFAIADLEREMAAEVAEAAPH